MFAFEALLYKMQHKLFVGHPCATESLAANYPPSKDVVGMMDKLYS
jgi:hypothetical protein